MAAEFDEIRRILETISGPQPSRPSVVGTRFELGIDQADDPAVYVTVLLDDKTKSKDWTSPKLDPIADRVKEAIRAGGIAHWPSVRFATPSDLKAAG